VGRLEIERLGLSVMVLEGVEPKTLRHGAGHIPGTAAPGERGNCGISAHRDRFFRPLREVRPDDVIRITTVRGGFAYRVVSVDVVDPSDGAVLAQGEGEALTLTTCFPFYFVGPAPARFVVRAERAHSLE